jgi:5-methylcytosine-specific restriction endonuclease McrA
MTADVRFQVLKRDGHRCRGCGATSEVEVLHVDHIIPVSKGGTTDLENLQTLCQTCNLGKSNRH